MQFSVLLLVVAINGALAAVWTVLIGLIWGYVAAIAHRLSRYWPVVLGTLLGALLLGCCAGVVTLLQQPEVVKPSTLASSTPSFIGAIGGMLWGYYDLTGWLRAFLSGDRRAAKEHFKRLARQAVSTGRSANRPLIVSAPSGNLSASSELSSEADVTSPSTPLERARQGDATAIALLINQQLQSQGITAQTRRQESLLRIGLRRETAFDIDQAVSFLQRGLERLNPQDIFEVQVMGQYGEGATQVWRRAFVLSPPAASKNSESGPSQVLPSRPSNAYQPPSDARKFVLEIGNARYEIQAVVVWTIATLLLLLDIASGAFLWIGLRLLFAFMPVGLAQSRGRPFLPWFLYGYIYAPLACIFALILPQAEPLSFARRDLRQAAFSQKSLQQANFQGANLREVDFSRANLAGANFKNAVCTGANFNGASISGACFDQAVLDGATFVQARQGKAAVSLNQVCGSISPIVWTVAVFVLLITTSVLMIVLAVYGWVLGGVAGGLITITRRNRGVAPWMLGGIVAVVSWAEFSEVESLWVALGVVAIAGSLAIAAQWSLKCNSWAGFGAAFGTLISLGVVEVWVAVVAMFVPQLAMKWVIWGVGAIVGCLVGAWMQQGMPSFRKASLNGTDFTGSDLRTADFRETDTAHTTFTGTRRQGALFPNQRQTSLSRLFQRPS